MTLVLATLWLSCSSIIAEGWRCLPKICFIVVDILLKSFDGVVYILWKSFDGVAAFSFTILKTSFGVVGK